MFNLKILYTGLLCLAICCRSLLTTTLLPLISNLTTQPTNHTHKEKMENNQKNLERFYQTKTGSIIRWFLTKKIVSQATGPFFADLSLSRYYINTFLKHNPEIIRHADQFESPIPGDLTSYKTFNQFFYRKLTASAFQERCSLCKDAMNVVSPADCHISVISDLSKNPDFYVKGCKFNLQTFLGSGREDIAREYADGILLLFRLAPDDYHRFHFPFDCTPSQPVRIKGRLESVNPIAYTPTTEEGRQGLYSPKVQPLLVNERHFIQLKTDLFDDVLCVAIGAMMIGKIHETYTPLVHVKRCAEMGYFAFGGSSLVLIFKKGTIAVNANLVTASMNIPEYKDIFRKFTHGQGSHIHYPEYPIKMGEPIAVSSKKTNKT